MSISRSLPGEIIVASHNKGKIAEITELLAPLGIAISSAADHGLDDPEETELTFSGNARLKAEHVMRATGKAALSDDSGLVIPALGGLPGIYSARWAGEPRSFERAIERVAAALGTAAAMRPAAHFTCALAFARPGHNTDIYVGHVHGHLTFPPRGSRGFGYDPIFVAEGQTDTFGEMEPAEKHAMSHRAEAFGLFVAALEGQ